MCRFSCRINPRVYFNFAYMRSFTPFGVSAVIRRFSNIGVSAVRYRITTDKMLAKCADFHVLESLRPYADTPFLGKKHTRSPHSPDVNIPSLFFFFFFFAFFFCSGLTLEMFIYRSTIKKKSPISSVQTPRNFSNSKPGTNMNGVFFFLFFLFLFFFFFCLFFFSLAMLVHEERCLPTTSTCSSGDCFLALTEDLYLGNLTPTSRLWGRSSYSRTQKINTKYS